VKHEGFDISREAARFDLLVRFFYERLLHVSGCF
jgi:hypothetical protein